MSIETELTTLQARLCTQGLYVDLDGTRLLAALQRENVEASATVDRFLRQVRVTRYDLKNGGTLVLEDEVTVEPHVDKWLFQNYLELRCGGINLDIVQCMRSSIAEIEEVVNNYFFREPLSIGDWILPVYQHPAWSEERIRSTIMSATVLPYNEVVKRISAESDAAETYDGLFYIARRKTRNGPLLYFRYDCNVAYICEAPLEPRFLPQVLMLKGDSRVGL